MKGQTHGGKGSAQRKTDQKKFAANWDAIYNKNTQSQVKRRNNA